MRRYKFKLFFIYLIAPPLYCYYASYSAVRFVNCFLKNVPDSVNYVTKYVSSYCFRHKTHTCKRVQLKSIKGK